MAGLPFDRFGQAAGDVSVIDRRRCLSAVALLLPGCARVPAAGDLPPLPAGAVPFTENGAWETPHDQFADRVYDTVQGRYPAIALTDYALPRRWSWPQIVSHYDAALVGRGWAVDEGMSRAFSRGWLRVWAGSAWLSGPRAIAVALRERPDPEGLELPHSFFVGVPRND